MQAHIAGRVLQPSTTWRLHPARIVHAWDGRVLWSEARLRVPAAVKQHEQRLDLVAGRNNQKLVHASNETRRILFPQQVVQEHSHGIHAQGLRP